MASIFLAYLVFTYKDFHLNSFHDSKQTENKAHTISVVNITLFAYQITRCFVKVVAIIINFIRENENVEI